jgi:hypothetical protein
MVARPLGVRIECPPTARAGIDPGHARTRCAAAPAASATFRSRPAGSTPIDTDPATAIQDDDAIARRLAAGEREARELEALRERIPTFRCVVGCHDCCGPVTASALEVGRLPVRTEAEHAAALARLDCVHLGPHGCQAYDERPLVCRLFGTTPRLPCPNGRRPVYLVDRRTEAAIQRFMQGTRQVLV